MLCPCWPRSTCFRHDHGTSSYYEAAKVPCTFVSISSRATWSNELDAYACSCTGMMLLDPEQHTPFQIAFNYWWQDAGNLPRKEEYQGANFKRSRASNSQQRCRRCRSRSLYKEIAYLMIDEVEGNKNILLLFFARGALILTPEALCTAKLLELGHRHYTSRYRIQLIHFCRQESQFKKIQHTRKIRAFFNSHEFTLSHHETIFSIWCPIPGAAMNGSSQRVFGCCWHRCRMQTAYIHLLTSMNENAQYSLGLCVFEKQVVPSTLGPSGQLSTKQQGHWPEYQKAKSRARLLCFCTEIGVCYFFYSKGHLKKCIVQAQIRPPNLILFFLSSLMDAVGMRTRQKNPVWLSTSASCLLSHNFCSVSSTKRRISVIRGAPLPTRIFTCHKKTKTSGMM